MSQNPIVPVFEKVPTGVDGFDEITGGGLPRSRTTLIMGNPGSGKTVFALQSLVNGIKRWDEPGIFVAFEENSKDIMVNSASFGWGLPELVESGKLFFIDARLSPDMVRTGDFDLIGMLASIQAKAQTMGARRIVFDSLDVLLTLKENILAERQELYRLHDWLSESVMTGIITVRLDDSDPLSVQRYGFMPFMADCVVQFQHRLHERVLLREMRILKYRGSNFTANEAAMAIGSTGVEVANIALVRLDYPVHNERVPTGVPRLDTMLVGGYYRGTNVLITGAPGTAKSSLAGAFAEAAARRGDRTLYISYDEAAAEHVRNLSSIGIDLAPLVKAGTLRMFSGWTAALGAEEHFISIRALINEFKPVCLVVDPLSAIIRAGGHTAAQGAAQRLLRLTKSMGITTVCTSLLDRPDVEAEATPIEISTIADTWVHLSYIIQGGERNRAITIVKSRGTRHSNQVRELVLSDKGITLADVYSAGGEVLMGTLRLEKEMIQNAEQERAQAELEQKRREMEAAEAEVAAQIQALQRELEMRRAALNTLMVEQRLRENVRMQGQQDILRMRGADDMLVRDNGQSSRESERSPLTKGREMED